MDKNKLIGGITRRANEIFVKMSGSPDFCISPGMVLAVMQAAQHSFAPDAPYCALCGAKLPAHNLPCPAFVA
jgi:hypothetical protein